MKKFLLLLALAACAPPAPAAQPKPRTVVPHDVVLIGGCEYYQFISSDGFSTYAPAVRRLKGAGGSSGGPLPGYTWCYP